MLGPWSTTYDMPQRAGDGVRVVNLVAAAELARHLRIPKAGDGGGAVLPTFTPVAVGDRVDLRMRCSDGARIDASGVIREVLGQGAEGPSWAHVVIVRSHAHRVRRMIQEAARPRPGDSRIPRVIDEVATLRVRGSNDLLDAITPPEGSGSAGTVELGWRGARKAGQRVQIEVSFGAMADEILLAGTVRDVRSLPRRSIPVAHIEFAAAHRHRVGYVVDVLRGLRDANARAHRRVEVQIPGAWWAGAQPRELVFEELSRGGTFIKTEQAPGLGSEVPLQFDSPRVGRVRVSAEVMWHSQEPTRLGFGARFRVGTRSLAEKIGLLMEREASPTAAWA